MRPEDDFNDPTERWRAGRAEPPSCCDICGELIPDGTGWYRCDLLTCDPCETQLRRSARLVGYAIMAEQHSCDSCGCNDLPEWVGRDVPSPFEDDERPRYLWAADDERPLIDHLIRSEDEPGEER